ncbi:MULTISPECIES: TIGR03087 family PEP-CTERM/XrtA system glycosyltransferase [Vibrio]|uniref:TIGR03087 family PEP-CTERM/XrtA system glycosyltransferase n=2 Tax=Vibrio TaxID=662 RepID=A0A7X4LP22_9VIBR|nr:MULTISPECIES: TIGR03087 family PEP-CTERM/XrtA system glycosyltransferase [Vibrio]MBF9002157.1 TIGR03087 family PEP-CTERM/XrtA system glycosyltransferase [Vibrio nitrifigilis]MZI95538.1 TIGR03087 family PEP-CTERM/XrtA system glycosyltransferase [Vibrio eleionomae]
MKEKLLYLCHRIPFPANKGDKITTCNTLKFLSEHFDIYLGCFIDDPFDHQYIKDVQRYCKESVFINLNSQLAKVRGLQAFITGKPITLPYYYHPKMQQWVTKVLNTQDIHKAFIYSGCMAQYVLGTSTPPLHKVIQFADIDSDKWRQYAEKTHGIMRWVYQREHRTLEKYEKYVANQFAVSCFISDNETNLFRDMIGDKNAAESRIQTLSNGIDCEFFSPSAKQALSEDYPLSEQNYIVFTGAMNYWANADAVAWFVRTIWPEVQQAIPDSKFYIVGSSPTKEVLELQNVPGVVVTGRVEDVRPYLLHAKASVAPMQIARGIQNKILEAMAMEKPVLTTELGIEGIENYPKDDVYIADSPNDMTHWVIEKLSLGLHAAVPSRSWLEATYSWPAKLSPLLSYLGSNDVK